ncbi:hypothetical protein [Dyella silvatica]|uniref:hypothetical protein n=1 Tax=Dyella silvatica TaxID=2992128 RepID=UPI002255F05E|nr:hypothetical protein [Dyella silvatica]
MGLLDQAGQAVQGLTDKATDNPVSQAIDSVAGGLNPKAAAGASGTPHYVEGDALNDSAAKTAFPVKPSHNDGGSAELLHVPLVLKKPIQFIHFSYAHDDSCDSFPGEAGSHGLAFRDALIREDVLLYSFARSAQCVLQQAKASKGAAGAMLETASSLLGGSQTASAGPETFDPILAQIRSAGDAVNTQAPDYPSVHGSGVKLAQAWATLGKTCKSALDPAKGGGLGLPSIPGLSNQLGPSVPSAVMQIPAWLFKVQDAYQAMYNVARDAYEWQIIKACHEYSMSAIQNDWRPSYDIWFLRDKPADNSPDGDKSSALEKTLKNAQSSLASLPLLGDSGPATSAADSLHDLQTSIAKRRQDASDRAGDITGWLATVESEQAQMPDGSAAALSKALAVLSSTPPSQSTRLKAGLGQAMANGLAKGLLGGGDGSAPTLPPFLETYVSTISDIALTLLPKIYSHLHGRYGLPSQALVLAAVHDAVATRIVDLIWSLIFGESAPGPGANDKKDLQKSGSSIIDNLGQGDLSAEKLPTVSQLENKLADLVLGFIRDQGHYVDCLIDFVAEDLYRELLAAHDDCDQRDVLSMEIYLGRLPMLAALLTRNLVFPIFNLVLKIFGIGDKLAGLVWDPVKHKLDQAGNIADTVKDDKDKLRHSGEDVAAGAKRAEDAIDKKQEQIGTDVKQLTSGTQFDGVGEAIGLANQKAQQANQLKNDVFDTPDEVMKAAKGDSNDSSSTADAKKTGSGPISATRKPSGRAATVTAGQIEQAGRVDPETEAQAIAARAADNAADSKGSSSTPLPGGSAMANPLS